MWIEQLPNGKYRAVERYTDPMTGKQKKVSVTIEKNTAATRKFAEKTLIEKIAEKTIYQSDINHLTFGSLVALWTEYLAKTVKQSTYKRNYWAGNSLMKILGEDVLVSKLNSGYVMKQLMKQYDKPGTINEHLVRFKSIMRFGYKFDYVQDISWLQKLQPLKDAEKKEKLADKFLETNELKSVLEYMNVDHWKNLTQFLALTGLRIGESFALRTDDIDLPSRLIHVTRTYDFVNGVYTTPKTDTSRRDVYITDELYPLCKILRSNALESKLNGGTGLIFHYGRADYYAYNKYFKMCTRTVLGRELTVHALRHTHVSLLAEHGVSLDTIARRLGHNNSNITKEVYFHVTKKLKEKENEQIKKISLL